MDKSEDKVHGASGLTDEDLEFYMDSRAETPLGSQSHVTSSQEPDAVISDDDAIISRALADNGLDPDLRHTCEFIVYYNQVAQGPGLHWNPERRVRFTLQTLNRMGALEREAETRPLDPLVSEVSPPRLSRNKPDVSGPDDLAVFGYHHLDRREITDNLVIMGGILGITLLAAGATYLSVSLDNPRASGTVGGISLAAIIAAIVRFAGKWHHRFPLRYRMVRLAVCMALLFSTAAWHMARGAWQIICSIAKTTIDIPAFGMSMFAVSGIISLLSHLALCRTFRPDHARILGWIEALSLTCAIGAFLFCAIHKP